MIKSFFKKYDLRFKIAAKTSRDTLLSKPSYFLIAFDTDEKFSAYGECSVIKGLSSDPEENYERKLAEVCRAIVKVNSPDIDINLSEFPSIAFGLESLSLQYINRRDHLLFDNSFYRGLSNIPINGLIWMGDITFMKKQIKEKIVQGFSCIKVKIGGIKFKEEISLLRHIRKEYNSSDIELRLDANGAFTFQNVMDKLKQLSEFNIHSIEQPIMAGQWEEMAQICKNSPIPIALDEELIGIKSYFEKRNLLSTIKPQYIILKPSLLGGFSLSDKWIELANEFGIKWWATSALESNIGLNAIAQWVSSKTTDIAQGLGTGALYSNNINSPLYINKAHLCYDLNKQWDSF
jgi:O-succinylbenzoate synthase